MFFWYNTFGDTMNEIILMRHAQTEANKNFIVQGRMDNPLNEDGYRQALTAGEYFAKNNFEFDMVISSPLKRAYATARQVNRGMLMHRPIVLDKGLIERNFGDFDGKEITDDYYYMVQRGLVPHMETNDVLEDRVENAILEICHKYPDKKLLIVTHSHVIKALLKRNVNGFSYKTNLYNCSLSKIVCDGDNIEVVDYNFNPLG